LFWGTKSSGLDAENIKIDIPSTKDDVAFLENAKTMEIDSLISLDNFKEAVKGITGILLRNAYVYKDDERYVNLKKLIDSYDSALGREARKALDPYVFTPLQDTFENQEKVPARKIVQVIELSIENISKLSEADWEELYEFCKPTKSIQRSRELNNNTDFIGPLLSYTPSKEDFYNPYQKWLNEFGIKDAIRIVIAGSFEVEKLKKQLPSLFSLKPNNQNIVSNEFIIAPLLEQLGATKKKIINKEELKGLWDAELVGKLLSGVEKTFQVLAQAHLDKEISDQDTAKLIADILNTLPSQAKIAEKIQSCAYAPKPIPKENINIGDGKLAFEISLNGSFSNPEDPKKPIDISFASFIFVVNLMTDNFLVAKNRIATMPFVKPGNYQGIFSESSLKNGASFELSQAPSLTVGEVRYNQATDGIHISNNAQAKLGKLTLEPIGRFLSVMPGYKPSFGLVNGGWGLIGTVAEFEPTGLATKIVNTGQSATKYIEKLATTPEQKRELVAPTSLYFDCDLSITFSLTSYSSDGKDGLNVVPNIVVSLINIAQNKLNSRGLSIKARFIEEDKWKDKIIAKVRDI
jgi:hypothetical protein